MQAAKSPGSEPGNAGENDPGVHEGVRVFGSGNSTGAPEFRGRASRGIVPYAPWVSLSTRAVDQFRGEKNKTETSSDQEWGLLSRWERRSDIIANAAANTRKSRNTAPFSQWHAV